MAETKGIIHSVESFGSVDGPGVRFVVFFQGCSMRCKYCHNADTWQTEPTADNMLVSARELFDLACKYKSYWGTNGGITASGGEPLLQIEFLTDFFSLAKSHGISTVLDTAGQPFSKAEPFFAQFKKLMKSTDLVMLDIKHIDNEKHVKLTGHTNKNILEMAKYLDEIGKPVWIRHVLVPGITDNKQDLESLRKFIDGLSNVEKVEVLPYHSIGQYKWETLGYTYPLKNTEPPTSESIESAKRILGA